MTLLLSISIFMSFLVLSTISISSYMASIRQITDKAEEINGNNLAQIKRKLENNLQEIKNITKDLMNNEILYRNIEKYETSDDTSDRVISYEEIRKIILKSVSYSPLIDSVAIVTNSNMFASSGIKDTYCKYSKFKNYPFYLQLAKDTDQPILFEYDDLKCLIPGRAEDAEKSGNAGSTSGSDASSVICCGLLTLDGNEIGYVIIRMANDWIYKLLRNSSNTVVLEKNSRLLWRNFEFKDLRRADIIKLLDRQTGKKQGKVQSSRFNIYYEKMDYLYWKILYIENVDRLTREIMNIRNYVFMALLMSILINVFLSKVISKRVTLPVSHLLDKINRYKNIDDFELFTYETRRRRPFGRSLIYYMIVSTIVPAVFYISIFYFSANGIIINKTNEAYYNSIKETLENVNLFFDNKLKILRRISFDDALQKIMTNDDIGKDRDIKNLGRIIYRNIQTGEGFMDISIFNKDYFLLYSNVDRNEKILDSSIISCISKMDGQKLVRTTGKDKFNGLSVNIIMRMVGIELYNQHYLDDIGYIRYIFNVTDVEEIYRGSRERTDDIFIINDKGIYVCHSNRSLIGERLPGFDSKILQNQSDRIRINNDDYFINQIEFSVEVGENWYLLNRIDRLDILIRNNNILLTNLYIVMVSFLIILFFSYQISNKLSLSLYNLNSLMYSFGNGISVRSLDISTAYENVEYTGPGIRSPGTSVGMAVKNTSRDVIAGDLNTFYIDEIEELGAAFNEMVVKIENLVDDLLIANIAKKQIEEGKKEAELTALQAQINPHFLYNTLELINRMIKEGCGQKAIIMINALSDLFRYGISRDEVLITLLEEIKYSNAYIEIMKVRYEEKITFKWNIEDGILKYKTLKLVLQPLIENAIHHGLEHRDMKGTIAIGCRSRSNKILIRVYDNGKGIDKKVLQEINDNLRSGIKGKIGIYNLNERIKLYFGPDSLLILKSTPRRGTLAKFYLDKL